MYDRWSLMPVRARSASAAPRRKPARSTSPTAADAAASPSSAYASPSSLRLRNEDGDAYALEGLVASSAAAGDVERAGFLLGAAEALRARTGIDDQRSYITYQSFVDAVLATDRAAEFEASRVVGRRMPRRAVLEVALERDSPVRVLD